ncbi:hypothetical protein HUJ05_010628 [Dendroctonus ponderosae]|nr:hypothetical protein HUJ05_010628 [Dendroctonus ponderosae]
MASEAGSSDSNELDPIYFERLNLSDCTGARRKLKFTPRRALSANNSFNSFQSLPHSDESSTTCSQPDSEPTCKKYRKKTGFVNKMPPMGIFWDIENVGVPKQKSAAAIVEKIRGVFLKDYRESEFMVVCDVKKEQPLIMQELHDSQNSHTYFYLTIHNLPKNIDQRKVKNRLGFLTNNCGGKCVEFLNEKGIACFRFGNFDLALRAHKRIQGEDVFGQKISVLAPSVRSYTGQREKKSDLFPQAQQGSSTSTRFNLEKNEVFPQINSAVPPPPGLENRSTNAYPYSNPPKKRQDFTPINKRKPPISMDRLGHPNFRPILRSGSSFSGSCVSPMELSYDQTQIRRSMSSKHNSPQDQQGACALSPYYRSQASGSSEFSDSDGKGYISSEISRNTQGTQPVDLTITNLDATIDVKELKRLLTNMIMKYVMVLHLNIVMQSDGTPVAHLRVRSQQEAQFIISQLHRQKLGHKRIIIAYEQDDSPDPEQLKVMVISVLQDAPNKSMHLFKFMELLESRYHCTVSISEVNKLKNVVCISDERGSRVISLTEEAIKVDPSYNLSQPMIPQCVIHCPKSMQTFGWCELNFSIVPNVLISLSLFTAKLMTLLNIHFGSMPLISFETCYDQVFEDPLPVADSGVPLEHLITCVPGVEIKLVGPNKSIKVIQHEVKENEEHTEENVLKAVAPSLASNVSLLCREVVDLLKNLDKCQILLTKFIPAYHHHFGRQCRVADYGYTKLLDLFEAISHVVQIMGDGSRRVITLTHSSQMRRFISDLLRVLKVQPNKQIAFTEFAAAYERTLNKPFNPVEYGLCTLDDLLCEVPENTIVITKENENIYISVPKREQTAVEIAKTKEFANEVINLLRHTPYSTMFFNKFVPSYHHHFGHQCKVSDYGFTKLIELFEAIPDVVEIKELPDGERTISLTLQQSLKILSAQVLRMIRNTCGGGLKLDELPMLYFKQYGYPLNPQIYQCESLEELVSNLSEYVQVIHSNAGSLLRPVEMDTSQSVLRVRCWAMLLVPPHVKNLVSFRNEYRQCYGNNFTTEDLRKIANVVSLSSMHNIDYISLTSLYVLAAQIYCVICNHGGSVEYNKLEQLYEESYGKPMKLSSFNINSVNEFYNRFNLLFYVRGSKKNSIVVPNRNLEEYIAFKYHNNNSEAEQQLNINNQWSDILSGSSDQEQGAVKKYTPPKPDTPPSPGSTLWWNSPSKLSQEQMNFFIDMPLTMDRTLHEMSKSLISPARYLLFSDTPWNLAQPPTLAPDPHELPIPNKLLPKAGMSDDSGDSGVNILADHSHSDSDLEPSTSKGAIKKKHYNGTFLNFKGVNFPITPGEIYGFYRTPQELENSLAVVETLFEEFFNPYTSNCRKHEIEVQLSEIKEVPHKGNLCLHFIKHSSSQHVIMFTLQILEFMVNQGQWPAMETEIQDELKTILPLTLISKSDIPNFLKSKYAKIIVNIAKVDKPGENSNFFYTVTNLLRSSEQLIGLILFRGMCEEFLGLNVKLQTLSCKKEVKKFQEDYIPRVLYLLTDILENISSKSKHTATATPPPSPTQNNSVEGQAPNHNYSADYPPDVRAIIQESLAILSLLFTSIPVEQVPLLTIRAVFNFTKCSSYSQDDDDLCLSAISTVNELFYRKSCPHGAEPLFKAIYILAVELLRNMTTSVTYRTENTDELFVDKISELLVLLIEQHFCRFEADPTFTALEFLSLFFQYTMSLTNSVHFLRCLSVWSTFFKRVKPYASVKYHQVCVGLGSALINKIQFSSNHAQLVDLLTINIDVNNTEWQFFLNSSAEIISQAAQLAPLETLHQLAWLGWMEARSQLNSNVDIFLNLLLPVLHEGDKVPVQVYSAASQLFLELSRRPNYLCPSSNRAVADFITKASDCYRAKLPAEPRFYWQVPKLKLNSPEIVNCIYSAICEILLKPLKSLNQHTLPVYKRLIDGFLKELSADFRSLTPKTAEVKVIETVHVLPALAHLIEYCRCYPLVSKKELASGIEQSNNLEGVKQLLDIFIVVVQESTNKNFFSDILQICMETIYPLLSSQAMEKPDVFLSFLELLYSILKFHWLYFYNSQVLMGFSPGCNEDEVGPDVPKRPEQLLAILKVFGEALMMDDINIFRQSLASLQELNRSKKLYHKVNSSQQSPVVESNSQSYLQGLFQSNLLPELLRVLLQTFVYKKQALAKEDIMLAVYDMSEVDFDGFIYKFLPLFLESADGLKGKFRDILLCHFQNNKERDIPSFMQNLQNFAADYEQVVLQIIKKFATMAKEN